MCELTCQQLFIDKCACIVKFCLNKDIFNRLIIKSLKYSASFHLCMSIVYQSSYLLNECS